METLKEIAIDFLIVVAGVIIITAQGAFDRAKGLSCGRAEVTQAQP
jgi:hypothetical protein